MEDVVQNSRNLSAIFHFERARINKLFMEGVNHPLVVVCAGAGYGKTIAVNDFTREYKARTVWLHFSQRDNVSARFWESFIPNMEKINLSLTKAITKLGFPDTPDKLEKYAECMRKYVEMKRRILVLDDFHFVESPDLIRFFEYTINNFPPWTSVFIITRTAPGLNLAGLFTKGHVFNINENDLRFTENELADYFHYLDISPRMEDMREIIQDTEGWAFAVNLVVRSFQKAPGYEGYLRKAMKSNIFRLMETEIWTELSEQMQYFLACLSLVHHLSFDLILLLACGNNNLIIEMERQNAYIRRDDYIHAYIIHPLFLEFLAGKQTLLTQKQRKETYAIAADWCNKNGFKMDALFYYEKTEDYSSIVSIFDEMPSQFSYEIAKFASDIFERIPAEAFVTVGSLAALHLRSYMCQGLLEKSLELAKHYEAIFLKLPKKNPFRNETLSILYYCWALLRVLLCVTDDVYDFDIYFEKFCKHIVMTDYAKYTNHYPGPWINACGSSKKGAPQEYIRCVKRSFDFIQKAFNGFTTGEYELIQGELSFYMGDLNSAQTYINSALELSKTFKHHEVHHRALSYLLRLSIATGNYPMTEKALKDMKAQLDDEQYANRYNNYDISLSWYYCILGYPEKTSNWLKQDFSPYKHAGFMENYANQIKAWYFYITRNFPPILSYIQELKTRESFLYGKIEMLAMEACIHYKLKDKRRAFDIFQEAYDNASPNEIILPFIELGKDMRTLSASAMKESSGAIPKSWLENINRKAATYAKRQAHIITEYQQINDMKATIELTPREKDILKDLSHGLSRAEIASARNLSINTVKMVINNVYNKAGARNMTDLIRIAVEKKMI